MHVIRLLPILLAAALTTACSEVRNSTGMISKRIGEAARAPGNVEVDLGKLTTFGWDSFYAFQPGTSREEVCKFVGAGRNACARIMRVERAPDDHMILIFGLQGQLTHVELHAVENGQFDLTFAESGHPRSASIFRVRRSSTNTGADAIWLEPK